MKDIPTRKRIFILALLFLIVLFLITCLLKVKIKDKNYCSNLENLSDLSLKKIALNNNSIIHISGTFLKDKCIIMGCDSSITMKDCKSNLKNNNCTYNIDGRKFKELIFKPNIFSLNNFSSAKIYDIKSKLKTCLDIEDDIFTKIGLYIFRRFYIYPNIKNIFKHAIKNESNFLTINIVSFGLKKEKSDILLFRINLDSNDISELSKISKLCEIFQEKKIIYDLNSIVLFIAYYFDYINISYDINEKIRNIHSLFKKFCLQKNILIIHFQKVILKKFYFPYYFDVIFFLIENLKKNFHYSKNINSDLFEKLLFFKMYFYIKKFQEYFLAFEAGFSNKMKRHDYYSYKRLKNFIILTNEMFNKLYDFKENILKFVLIFEKVLKSVVNEDIKNIDVYYQYLPLKKVFIAKDRLLFYSIKTLLDDPVRAVLVKNKIHLRPGCKERLYLPRAELGRGLHSVELRSEHMLLQLLDCLEKSKEISTRRAAILKVENNNKTHLALIKGFLKVKYRLVEEAQLAKLYNEIEKRKLHSKLYNA
ncbi:hypothetical protein CWI36_1521p0010, partial [Hamiltosporidium magnivora]